MIPRVRSVDYVKRVVEYVKDHRLDLLMKGLAVAEVARDLRQVHAQGTRLVVVVSAMGKTTDELLGLARSVHPDPPRRELDMLVSVGMAKDFLARGVRRFTVWMVSSPSRAALSLART